ncbi:MAG TPA: glycoside hydrolase family 3 N-terminal domain-containing protein [Ktedonobacterales bacterium]
MESPGLTAEMTLEEQLGQVVVVGFTGTQVTPEVADLIARQRVGGIILFSRNVADTQQVLALTRDLQAVARAAGQRYPLLIAIDQENGVVRRLGRGATIFPGNMALAATGSEQLVYDVALATGRELKALGINLNLAPVVDVNNNPNNPVIGVRSFGEDTHAVARLGVAAARGYRAAGVIGCLKHFPGHGDTVVDSHAGVPTVPVDLQRLESVELVPFRAGIAAGAASVMVGHIAFSHLTTHPTLPASISPEIVHDLLRERLGFGGVIASDCLEMGAIADTVGTERGAVMALRAGIHLMLVSHRYDRQTGALAAIADAVRAGELPAGAARQAAERVLAMKARDLSWDLLTPPVAEWVGGAAHRQLAAQAYALAVTLVRDDAALLPLRLRPDERLLVLDPSGEAGTPAEEQRGAEGWLAASCARRHGRVDALPLSLRPTAGEREQVAQRAAGADLIIVATKNAHLHPEQAEVVRRLVQTGRRVIGVAVHNPYDLVAFPELRTYVVTYEYTPPVMEAAARVLWGEVTPQGRLPVALPGLYPRGHGADMGRSAGGA